MDGSRRHTAFHKLGIISQDFALQLNWIKKHNQMRPDKVTRLIIISLLSSYFGHNTWLMKLHFLRVSLWVTINLPNFTE